MCVQADAATDEVYARLALVAEGKVSAASTASRCFMLGALLVLGSCWLLAAGARPSQQKKKKVLSIFVPGMVEMASVPLTSFPVSFPLCISSEGRA